MKDFMEENFPFIVLMIIGILGFSAIMHVFNKQTTIVEKALNYAIEQNAEVVIK